MIINGFLLETSFPGTASVSDLFYRCTFTCICWTVARKDPISEKSVIVTVGILIQSTATSNGALWSFQVLFSICVMSNFNYLAKFKSLSLLLEFENNNTLPNLRITVQNGEISDGLSRLLT